MSSKKQEGILFVTSTPTLVTPSAWNKWYDSEHIPDVLATSGFSTAFRYNNITQSTIFKSEKDGEKKEEFLAMYPVKDLDWLESDEYKSIPVTSKLLAGDDKKERVCFHVAELEPRYYAWVDDFEGSGAKYHPAPGKLIITAAMAPPKDQEEDFDLWYKNEHYRTLSECKGYLRTRRYRIHKTLSANGKQAPTFLTIHEFEDGELDGEGLGRSGSTEWSKKVMGGLVESEMAVWRMRGGWGDLKAKF